MNQEHSGIIVRKTFSDELSCFGWNFGGDVSPPLTKLDWVATI